MKQKICARDATLSRSTSTSTHASVTPSMNPKCFLNNFSINLLHTSKMGKPNSAVGFSLPGIHRNSFPSLRFYVAELKKEGILSMRVPWHSVRVGCPEKL